jgi:hypothetical protein
MRPRYLTGVAVIVACGLLAASCALDERLVTVALPALDMRATLSGIGLEKVGSTSLLPLAVASAEGNPAEGSLFHEGSARELQAGALPDGAACNQNADCLSNSCRNWSPDDDGDGFGASATVFRRCGPPGPGFAGNANDCCDVDDLTRPGQTAFLDRDDGCGRFDYNCNGVIEFFPPVASCADFDEDSCGVPNESVVLVSIQPVCGVPSPGAQCFFVNGACQSVRGVLLTPSCR